MIWEGWNIGAVTVRRVRVDENRVVSVHLQRHGGDPRSVIRAMIEEEEGLPNIHKVQ